MAVEAAKSVARPTTGEAQNRDKRIISPVIGLLANTTCDKQKQKNALYMLNTISFRGKFGL
jgi:hypothetical protein